MTWPPQTRRSILTAVLVVAFVAGVIVCFWPGLAPDGALGGERHPLGL